jgi:transcriptional regulator with GAF, ATPase, and Fis domain
VSPDVATAAHDMPPTRDHDEVTATRAIPTSGLVRLRGAAFEVVAGPDRGHAIKMESPSLTVGKGTDVDVRLTDPAISRRHLEFAATADGLLVRDLGSRNGTWLGGCRIAEATLVQDVTLSFGQTSMAVRLAEGQLDLEVSPRTEFGGALGASIAMRHVFAMLEKAARASVTVLLEAESGCGKEVLAYALHQESPRAEQPFVAVDCASLPENLIESELFGHERGAFTGAVAARAGAFERANGGTIFLDELGELPLEQQAKLLRVLEKREIRRVGGSKTIPIDVRVVAATNKRLAEAVRRREFREDLYYRVSVIRVVVPPLRDRREDIPALAQHFLERTRGEKAEIPADLVQVLLAHPWPGNVRELRNVVERWATFESARPEVLFGEAIGTAGQPAKAGVLGGIGDLAGLPYHEAKRRVLEAFDRAYFPDVLRRVGGVVAKAAELAQVPRPSFHRMLSRARAAEGYGDEDGGSGSERG